MEGTSTKSSGEGLERSCGEAPADWLRLSDPVGGIELLEARFSGPAYRPHRHDVYAIGLTTSGVQRFGYRGETRTGLPGEVHVLHPDELHDGFAGTEAGFGYRLLYIDPALIFAAVHQATGRTGSLPFVREAVVRAPRLAGAIRDAFDAGPEPLALDDIVVRLAEGLLAADPSGGSPQESQRLDLTAIARARSFLDAETERVVRSDELEAVTGLTRYEFARQFRRVHGTSPYRYSLMRRLGAARARLAEGRSPVHVAVDAGFADQAHFTRMFAATYGITPARYARLRAPDRRSSVNVDTNIGSGLPICHTPERKCG